MVIFGKSLEKQLLDQLAHFFVGVGLAAMLNTTISGMEAIPYVFGIAYLREVWQHRSFRLGWGSAFDISFFVVGSLTWAAILYWR